MNMFYAVFTLVLIGAFEVDSQIAQDVVNGPMTWNGDLFDASTLDPYGSAFLEQEQTPPMIEAASECMTMITTDSTAFVDFIAKRPTRQLRRPLKHAELRSDKFRHAVSAGVSFYEQKQNGSSTLQVTLLKSGCIQSLAGELIFFVFDANETVICDTTAVNATCSADIVRSVECRSRVHLSVSRGFHPFYTSCHSEDFFDIERRKVKIVYYD